MNTIDFQKSVNKELEVIRNRVRNLIGNKHWGEEGRYKEAIVKNLITRFLPNGISLRSGFIIRFKEDDKNKISNQLDIMAYNNNYPLLFSEGDFVITTHKNVRGIIEVKTNAANLNLNEVIKKAAKNSCFFEETDERNYFNGIFIFEKDNPGKNKIFNLESDNLKKALKAANGKVNHLSIGKDIFIKYWGIGFRTETNEISEKRKYSFYKLKNLAFSYFVSNFVDHVSKLDLNDRRKFYYPENKENYKIFDLFLDE